MREFTEMCVLKVAQEEKIMYFQVLMRHKFFEKLKKQKMKKGYA
ncbi:hypothetical protein cje22_10004 [Campylobacter jejuni subsp. jejuni 1997-10]|nr:hypothetical protein cje22_10004 [Campylobacter jejuni subsp. jejuni 1997-10]